MTIYINHKADSPIASVEFSPVSDGNFCFITLRSPHDQEPIKQWLAKKDIDQEIIAESKLGDQHVIVTHGDRTQAQMLELFAGHGDALIKDTKKRPFNSWKWRGTLSMIGQPMQLASSIMGPKGFDFGVGLFAVMNITANIVNIAFGSQKSEDKNRLDFLKGKINQDLSKDIGEDKLIPINEKLLPIRKEPEAPKSTGQKIGSFMQGYSVTIGEIGLRYLGGISLVFPIDRWKSGYKALMEKGTAKEVFQATRNKDKFIATAGAFWLVGKTIAFFSKVPDPYDPKPHSALDKFREKYVFKISSLTEMAGAGTLAWHRLKTSKIKFPNKSFIPSGLRGKQTPDYLGSIGGLLFMGAFGMRLFAPYGVKQLDTEELHAHASDTLAKTPPDKLPQLMAQTASTVKENLKDVDVSYGQIFTKMMTDLYRYHHIALDNLGTEPEERLAEQQKKSVATQKVLVNYPGTQTPTTKKILAKPARDPMDFAGAASSSHTERTAKVEATATQLSVG